MRAAVRTTTSQWTFSIAGSIQQAAAAAAAAAADFRLEGPVGEGKEQFNAQAHASEQEAYNEWIHANGTGKIIRMQG